MLSTLFAELSGELSGERAREHVAEIGRFYRSPGSSGYHATIDYVRGVLDASGLDHEVEEFPLDGEAVTGGERVPLAWEPTSATLELVAPAAGVLVRFDECGSCLPWWCPPTPAEGVELELVDVGTGERDADYAGRDVAGKAVLLHDARENFAWGDIVARAVRHGAAAIVTNYLLYQYAPWRTRDGLREAVQQLRLPARHENPWTFTVSQDAFDRLRGALGQGRTVLRFTVDAQTFASTSRSVLATLPGRDLPDESLLLVAHVTAATRPGANCASGVALLLELARALRDLQASGRIPPLRRSLHFLFANEGLGSTTLAERRPALRDGLLAAFALCSVGHDQARTRSALVAGRSPGALPTFVNELVESAIELPRRELPWAYRGGAPPIPYVRWKVLPYTPWSDNATWSKLGVPGLLFMSLPDRFFHTQLLTVEETDPVVFRHCGSVIGSAAGLAAIAGGPETAEVLRRVAARADAHLQEAALEGLDGDPTRAADALAYTLGRDLASLRTAVGLAPAAERPAAEALAAELEARLRATADALGAGLDGAAPAGADGAVALVPRRVDGHVPHGVPGFDYDGMLELARRMGEHDPNVVVESLQLFADELWALSTGEHDIAACARAIGHEFGFVLDPGDVLSIARGYERAGHLELAPASPSASR